MATVIRATLEHLDLVHPLFCDYRQFYRLPREEDAARTFLRARLQRRDSAILLALDGSSGEAAGFVQLYPVFSSLHMTPAWILNDLFIPHAFRRHGVAHELLDAANQLARETGASLLELSTGSDNSAAQRLYESRGWKRDTEFLHYSLDLE
jgi:ribosomal protein S18 acetylase RimI-like enzyme